MLRRNTMTAALARGALTLALPAGAASAETFATISPAELLGVLGDPAPGLALDLSEGDATLAGVIDGWPFAIYFYQCDGEDFIAPASADSACLGFEYRTYLEGYPDDAETINAWNAAHHYGVLWRDEEDDLALQLNVVVEGGVTGANIRATFGWWRAVLDSFAKFMEGR